MEPVLARYRFLYSVSSSAPELFDGNALLVPRDVDQEEVEGTRKFTLASWTELSKSTRISLYRHVGGKLDMLTVAYELASIAVCVGT